MKIKKPHPHAEQKPKIVSSLTNKEIFHIFDDLGCLPTRLKNIADISAQRAMEELKIPNDAWFDGPCWDYEEKCVAMRAIDYFIADINGGKL